MKIELSFIIPIYNGDIKKLHRCVSSILKISGINIEVILVDDGSRKNLHDSYQKYANEVGIRYFFQDNHGVSSARNLGVSKAAGDYIIFVDSDDYILPTALNSRILKEKNDLTIFEVEKKNFSRGKDQIYSLFDKSKHVSYSDLLKFTLCDGLMNWSVAKLYSRKFIKNHKIHFNDELHTGEDIDFVLKILKSQPKALYVKKILYIYEYSDETGLKRTLSAPTRTIEDAKYLFEKRIGVLEYLNLPNKNHYKNIIGENYLQSLYEIFSILISYKEEKDVRKFQKLILKNIFESKLNLKNIGICNKIRFYLLKNNRITDIRILYKTKECIKRVLAALNNKKMMIGK